MTSGEVVEGHVGRDADDQAKGGGEEGDADSGGGGLHDVLCADVGFDVSEGHDHSLHGAEEAEHGGDRGDGGEDGKVRSRAATMLVP